MSKQRKANILIIDDNLINRKKLLLAVKNLGYTGEAFKDGATGLTAAAEGSFHAILLDMLMPGMDGFEVLARLKCNAMLSELPVIVISDLENDTQSVSTAIEMGAEDFLPKDFDPNILNARLSACLQKKQLREQERDYFRRIDALTYAAKSVEAGRFDAESLKLTEEAKHDDPIGRLAFMFQGMADEILSRERKLINRVQTLQCSFLLLICGGSAGLMPSLSRITVGMGANPIGMSVWVDLIAAALCLSIIVLKGSIPKLSRSDVLFFVIWAFVVGILQHISIFVLAGHVQATFLTLVLALEGLLVFAFAAMMRLEKAAPMRVFGLLLGLLGVSMSLYHRMDGNGVQANFWLFAAMLAPFIFAIETIALSAKRPDHINPVSAVGIMFAFSTVLATILSWSTGNFMPLSALASPMGGVIAVIAIVTVLVNTTLLILLKQAGGVFTSQKAYITAIAGVLWGMLLLGEKLSPLAWAAIGLVLLGMYLVGSKVSNEPITIERNFNV